MKRPLRLMVFDRTCRTHQVGSWRLPFGLSHAWGLGGPLYRALGHLDAWFGASSWTEALTWLAQVKRPAAVEEVQFWGHGRWGQAFIAGEALDRTALMPGHPLQRPLREVAARLVPDNQALWWFRTCETFATAAGQDFATHFANTLGSRVAGHTHVIGIVQSGLCVLEPGQTPMWSAGQGVQADEQGQPKPLRSRWRERDTISFLRGRLPKA